MILIKRFKALSDETRLRLFYLLLSYELNVNEIVTIIGMIQSGISRHLKILLESGLLNSRKDGSFIYYSGNRNKENSPLVELVHQSLSGESLCIQDMENAEKIIKERQNRTKRFFKNVAKKWDRLKKEVIGEFDLNKKIEQQISSFSHTVDLGCGTGELIERLQSESKRFVGIDSSPEMLDQARERLILAHNVELRLGELEHLPMKNKEVECAVMSMVLHHISVPLKAIIEAQRVLKTNGLFVLSDFEKHDQEHIQKIIGGAWLGFERIQIETWLYQAGFVLKSVERFPVQHNLFINTYCALKE